MAGMRKQLQRKAKAADTRVAPKTRPTNAATKTRPRTSSAVGKLSPRPPAKAAKSPVKTPARTSPPQQPSSGSGSGGGGDSSPSTSRPSSNSSGGKFKLPGDPASTLLAGEVVCVAALVTYDMLQSQGQKLPRPGPPLSALVFYALLALVGSVGPAAARVAGMVGAVLALTVLVTGKRGAGILGLLTKITGMVSSTVGNPPPAGNLPAGTATTSGGVTTRSVVRGNTKRTSITDQAGNVTRIVATGP